MEKSAVAIERKNIIVLMCCIAFGAVVITAVDSMGGVEVTDQLMFLLAQIAFVIIPGFALAQVLNPPKDIPSFFIISYLLGIGIVIAEYFLFYALGLKDWLGLCMGIVSVLCLFVIYKKRTALKNLKDAPLCPAYFVLLGGMILITLLATISNYNIPAESGYTYIYQDLMWNTGNVASIAHGFPVMDIHIEGFSFGYHYFANVFLAVFQNILGFSSYVLNLKFFAIVQAFVLAGGLYLLFGELFKNKWISIAAAMIALVCSTLTMQHYMWYAFATPVGLGFALAAATYFIRFMRAMNTAKFTNRDFIIFLLLLAVAAGLKSLVAGGVIAGAGIVILAQIFRRKNVKNMLIAGVLTLAVFMGMYMIMVFGTHSPNSLMREFAATMYAETPNQPEYYAAIRIAFPNLPILGAKLLAYPLFLLKNYPVTVISLIALFVSLILQIKKKIVVKDWPLGSGRVKLFLFAGIFVCLCVMSVVSQPGESQVLFLEGTVPLSVFALLYVAREALGGGRKAAKAAVCCVVAFALGWGLCLSVRTLNADSKNLPARNDSQEAVLQNPFDSISKNEYDAMLWLKQNTEEDAVFASDRHYFVNAENSDVARYYYYTAFSERQCYLEGYNYISTYEKNYDDIINQRLLTLDGALANDENAIAQMLADGVDYFVVSRLINPVFELDPSFGTAVFENTHISVYELYK